MPGLNKMCRPGLSPVAACTEDPTGTGRLFVSVLELNVDTGFFAFLLDEVAKLVLADATKKRGHLGLLQNPLQQSNKSS